MTEQQTQPVGDLPTETPNRGGQPNRQASVQAKVESVVATVVADAGIELIELRVLRAPRNSYRVQLFVDRPFDQPGVTVDVCASVSRKVGAVLELDDPFPGNWDLEVSSPGMHRLLRGTSDFNLFAGVRVRIKTSTPEGGRVTWIGELVAVDDQSVSLRVDGGALQVVARTEIERAELDPTIEQWLELGQQRGKSAATDGSNDPEDATATEVAIEGVAG